MDDIKLWRGETMRKEGVLVSEERMGYVNGIKQSPFDGEECRETKRWSDGILDGWMTVPSRWLESIQPCTN